MIQMLFALFAFVFLALAALTVDLGSVRLTHLQMRNGVEAAAMEGLRLSDTVASDDERREAAREFMQWVYDDDFDTSSGDDWQHGAGPLFELSGDGTGASALQTLTAPEPRVYRPDLQLNLANEIHGDIFAARYLIDVLDHDEASDYTRPDLYIPPTAIGLANALAAAIAALDLPPGIAKSLTNKVNKAVEELRLYEEDGNLGPALAGLESFRSELLAQRGKHIPEDVADELLAIVDQILALLENEPAGLRALLVRLRRTRNPTIWDEVPPLDAVAGVSSSGPRISYLFGRGSLIDNSRRREGVVVRATAIAAARQATVVGRAGWANGATPFVLQYTFWNSMSSGTVVLRPDAAGNLSQGGTVVGFCVERRAWSIGNNAALEAAPPSSPSEEEVYVPIYEILDAPRVVGFGIVGAVALPNGDFQISRYRRRIAPVNASAAVAPGLAGLSDSQLRAVLGYNRSLAEPLLAPVLVR